jgi:hypothetical protein
MLHAACSCARAQVEEKDYEIEEIQGALKKKQKPPPRLGELEEIVAQYREHVDYLEKVRVEGFGWE